LRKIVYILILLHTFAWGQQDNLYTQFMYNPSSINPGYTGSRQVTTIFIQGREQWMGFEGAPSSSNFNIQHYREDSKLGLGLDFFSDAIGPYDEKSFSINTSYQLQLSDDKYLGLGLQAALSSVNLDFSIVELSDPNDPFYESNLQNRINPNIGVGFYYYDSSTYFGISAPRLFNTFNYEPLRSERFKITFENIHMYLMAGHVFQLTNSLRFKPAILARYVESQPFLINYSASFDLQKKLSFGASYSKGISISTLLGVQLIDNLFVGYSYDINTGAIDIGRGSHEIILRFELRSIYNKVWSDRFF
jgi:type IX secretion system PorP/SprF family membrane protein